MEFLLAIFKICIVFSVLLRQSQAYLVLARTFEQYTESLKLEERTSSGFFSFLDCIRKQSRQRWRRLRQWRYYQNFSWYFLIYALLVCFIKYLLRIPHLEFEYRIFSSRFRPFLAIDCFEKWVERPQIILWMGLFFSTTTHGKNILFTSESWVLIRRIEINFFFHSAPSTQSYAVNCSI